MFALAQGGYQDPVGYGGDHAQLFCNRDDALWHDGTFYGVLPAQQRLRTDNPGCLDIYQRLVVEFKFVIVNGRADLARIAQLLAGADIVCRVEILVRESVTLGTVHRAFRVA